MATQLKHTDFTYTPTRPNIRVAFIAGEATAAVNDPAANIPAEKTLEELAIAEAATNAIAQARALLSPAVYGAFVRWGEAAARFSTAYDHNAEGDARCGAYGETYTALGAVPAVNTHDLALKVWLINLDAADAPPLGPIGYQNPDGLSGVNSGVQADIMRASPLVATLDDVGAQAWKLSVNNLAWDAPIGAALTSAFTDAVEALTAEPTGSFREMLAERNALVADMDEGPARTDEEYAVMGGTINRLESAIIKRPVESADDAVLKLITLAQITAGGHEVEDTEAARAVVEAQRHFGIGHVQQHLRKVMPTLLTTPSSDASAVQWQAAYALYEQAAAELAAFDREVCRPASKLCVALKGALNDDAPAAAFEAHSAAVATIEAAEQRYETLLGSKSAAMDALLRLPAPGPGGLAMKLRLYSETYDWGSPEQREAGEQITIDAHRFAHHDAPIQADRAILDAYAGRRREYEDHRGIKLTKDDEDAFFERCDAMEAVLQDTSATTIEGVIAKLRVAFMQMVGEGWSDHAIADPTCPAFVKGLRMDDAFTQLAWSAIEDLARIGGVNLAEQGR